jgi:hypothetical protein
MVVILDIDAGRKGIGRCNVVQTSNLTHDAPQDLVCIRTSFDYNDIEGNPHEKNVSQTRDEVCGNESSSSSLIIVMPSLFVMK